MRRNWRVVNEVMRMYKKVNMLYVRKLTDDVRKKLLKPENNWVDKKGDKFLEHQVVYVDDDVIVAVWRNNNWTEVYAYFA